MVDQSIKELASNNDTTSIHGYTSAQGDKGARNTITGDLNHRYGTSYNEDHIYMTCRAAVSLTISFKAIVESKEDEITAFAPYFNEYKAFVETSGAKFIAVDINLGNFKPTLKI